MATFFLNCKNNKKTSKKTTLKLEILSKSNQISPNFGKYLDKIFNFTFKGQNVAPICKKK